MKRAGLLATLVAAGPLAASSSVAAPPGGPAHPEGPPSASPAPADAPAGAVGDLAIQAHQGTPGGPPIADAEVEIQLLHQGLVIDSITSRLDEHGVVVVDAVPLTMEIVPVVRLVHAGVVYEQAGELMSAEQPHQAIDITCYETTDEEPPWSVDVRHVMIMPHGTGVRVTEIIVARNPADRSWLGVAGDVDRRTAIFTLPDGAREVALQRGFPGGCCATLSAGRLISHAPLPPGETEIGFTYNVPAAADGTVAVAFTAPADVTETMVVIPDGMTTTGVEGLADAQVGVVGEQQIRSYRSGPQPAGETVRLTFGPVSAAIAPPAPAVAGNEAGSAGSADVARIVAALGGGLILLVAVVIILRPASARQAG
ncbi:MAG: hypothetical protein ACYTG1_05070 [Planctomycetota bacterium]